MRSHSSHSANTNGSIARSVPPVSSTFSHCSTNLPGGRSVPRSIALTVAPL